MLYQSTLFITTVTNLFSLDSVIKVTMIELTDGYAIVHVKLNKVQFIHQTVKFAERLFQMLKQSIILDTIFSGC